MPADQQILGLMRQTVGWEHYTGQDRHAEPTYESSETLTCHIEPAEAREEAIRGASGTVVVPRLRLYFDPADEDVQTFTLEDRFTVSDLAGGQPMQPARIDSVYGPDGDAWVVEVVL